ncbi:hypothetical protein E6H36_08730 [Candidatus Bathyarchaeota archaeon]|nr:MAG: hypothetical protein E6H36_08730 [Candidatus Bathyarchaeota archaeon]
MARAGSHTSDFWGLVSCDMSRYRMGISAGRYWKDKGAPPLGRYFSRTCVAGCGAPLGRCLSREPQRNCHGSVGFPVLVCSSWLHILVLYLRKAEGCCYLVTVVTLQSFRKKIPSNGKGPGEHITKRLELLFLGTGGADTTPRIGCKCRVCQEARRKGGRFARNGPSLFLLGPSLLFDTPEDIAKSLEREQIHRVRRLLYTHWHPDHTMGRRVLEQLNMSILNLKGRKMTDIWLPTWVREDFRRRLGLDEHLQFFERMGIAKIHEITAGETLVVDGVSLRAYRMAQPGLTAFLVKAGKKRVVLAVDDTKGWVPSDQMVEPDLLVMEAGWFELDPRGHVLVPENHWVRRSEASFDETLKLIKRIKPRQTVLTHIEEMNARSYTDYLKLERKYEDLRIQFAYDGLRLKV